MSAPPFSATPARAEGRYSASIQSYAVDAAGVTWYSVLVAQGDGGAAWTVQRRYRDFEQLSRSLGAQGVLLPSMPVKSAIRKRISRSFNDDRQRQLDQLLQAALNADPHVQHFAALFNFLAPSHAPAAARGGPVGVPSAPPALAVPVPVAPATPVAPAAPVPPAAPVAAVPALGTPAAPVLVAPVQAHPAACAPLSRPMYQGTHFHGLHHHPHVYEDPYYHGHHHQHVYEDPCRHRPHHMGAGAAVGAGVAGFAAGALGGMMLEQALDRRQDKLIIERPGLGGFGLGPGFGGFGGFGGPGPFGTEEVIREERRDMFGDTEVRTEIIDRDMFGNVTEVREDIVDRNMFGDVRETTIFSDGW